MYKLKKQYRLPYYDYSWPGYYFITICIKDRFCYFGNITDERMNLSEIGRIVQMFWMEIPIRFPTIRLDEWVIMPNHVHGILAIERNDNGRDASWRVPTRPGLRPLDKNSISSIINNFKGNVKRYCNKNDMEYFGWQSRFHDHIIRNERSLEAIQRYIRENPKRWGRDRLYFRNNKNGN